MGVKIIAILLLVSMASIAHSLKCYTCEVGLAVEDHACLDPTNTDLEPKIKEQDCGEKSDVCATITYENNIKRHCGIGLISGQALCNRENGEYVSCTTCETDLCNAEKGGAAIMATSSALVVTFVGFLFVFQH